MSPPELDLENEENDPILGNGDRLSERLKKIDLEQEETCSVDQMRALLNRE